MAQKINLAVLNKKKEELDQKEMKELRGGSEGCSYCTVIYDNTTATSMREDLSCPCASIWVVFGLSL